MKDSKIIKYPYTPCPLRKTLDLTALHTAFAHSMEPGYSSQSESHNFWEIIVVLEGEATVVTGEAVILLKKNSMVVHPPLEFHRHFNHSQIRNKYAVLSFSADRTPEAKKGTYSLSSSEVVEFRAIIQLIREQYVMDKICVLHKKTTARPSIDQEVKSRLEFFLSTVLFNQISPYNDSDRDYQRIVSYLRDNIHRNLTVPLIAEELEMSVANLKRIFSLYAGIGIMKHFNQLKFQKAVQLLEQGHSVQEVSEMLAFTSQSVFSTAFKKAMGIPPSKFRKKEE